MLNPSSFADLLRRKFSVCFAAASGYHRAPATDSPDAIKLRASGMPTERVSNPLTGHDLFIKVKPLAQHLPVCVLLLDKNSDFV